MQRPTFGVYNHCNTVADVVAHNVAYLQAWLELDATDDLPYAQPWIGTGVFANAFGCAYHWRENDPPHVRYACATLREALARPYPDWRESPVMAMVLEAINGLKEATGGRVPISLTDTQSAFDTATLVLDACEVFAGCLEEPEAMDAFLDRIADLVIVFSRVQAERIGAGLLAQPGHMFPSWVGGRGIALSDDNLAVASPEVNERFSLPRNERIGAAFGGVAVHSCGRWSHTMARLPRWPMHYMIDCAIGPAVDPNPNEPRAVREALAGTGVICKARVGGPLEQTLPRILDLAAPDLRLMVELPCEPGRETSDYERVKAALDRVYGGA